MPATISIFRDWGITSAIVKFTAQFRAEDRIEEIRNIFLTGLIFEVVVGLALTAVSFFLANFIATDVFNRPLIAPLIQIASLSILATGLVSAATSVFTGYERMELNSIMLVVQSIIKTLVIIGLLILGFGTAGATIGYTVGAVIAGVIGVALIWTIYAQLPKPSSVKHEIKAYLTAMLTYCLPLSIGTLIGSLLAQFYAFLLPIYYVADNVQIGNYGIATTFVVLITFFATPITTMLFPAFSKLDAKRDKETLRNIFQYSIKYASLLVLPTTGLVLCLAEPVVQTLFGTAYSTAPFYLALLAIQYLLTAFGLLTVGGFLNGQGETNFSLKLSIITAIFGFPLGYFLIMSFGVIGFIAATVLDGVPSLVLALIFIKKKYGFSLDWWSSLKILSSTLLASVITYFVISELSFASWIELILGACLFVLILVPLMLLSRSITHSDIGNLRFMAKGLGSISGIIDKILSLIERLMAILRL